MSGARGRFVWVDLMTTQPAEAKAFYSEIIGWTTKPFGDSGGGYEMWSIGGTEIGGLMLLPKEAEEAGAPPHWLSYVAVENADRTASQAKELGGKILVPGTDIPDVGRFAVLADPQGAVFAVVQLQGDMPPPKREPLGHASWAELNTTDWKMAWRFYSKLFGWTKTHSMDMGPEMGEYFMFSAGEEHSLGGMSNAAAMMNAPPHWLPYFNVASADETAKQIQAKGGKVLHGPSDIPGGDRIAQCMDPQGAVFAIYSSGGPK